MQTAQFAAGLAELMKLAARAQIAVMCAEAVPWRCHRSLIADALRAKRVPVEHIMSATRAQPHEPTPFIHVSRGRITYPANQAQTEMNFGEVTRRTPRKRKPPRKPASA